MKTILKLFLMLCLCLSQIIPMGAKEGDDKIKVACVGNSITFGAGINNRFLNSYPGILQQWLGSSYEVRNFGFSARTLLNKGDHPYMHEKMYNDAKEFLPNIVTIKLGTNDSKPKNWIHKNDFQKDLESMVDEFRTLPSQPKIYLCLPVPPTKVQWGINDSIIHNHIIPIIRKVAERKDVAVIDLYSALKPYPQYFPDHVHPDPKGSELIAREIYRAITGKDAPEHHPDQAFPGKKSEWNGCERYDFVCNGRDATVVVPEQAAEGNPWIWRPAFFGAFPSVDKALLEKGFHIVYYDLTHFYGSPRAVRLGNEFYNVMTGFFHLSHKVVLEGFSRGGYFAINWAAANTDKVACLYVDAPVCDLTSWPGRKSKDLWQGMLEEMEVKDADVTSSFRYNVLQLLPKLAKAGIPIIGVCGDSDQTVPYQDNFKLVREAYQDMGGIVEQILKKGCDHHPHSLDNPEPIVDFILRYRPGNSRYQHIHFRNDLSNAFLRFKQEKKGCVAFLGGSITQMRGWKEQIGEDLQQRFPETEFNFINAGIASTGSTPHAFRLEHDVLSHGTPDLLFLEAAVNDHTNGFTPIEQVRAMEGIVRQLHQRNPMMDIVILDFIYDPFIPLLEKDIQPDVIMNHERVANAYSLTSINMAYEIAQRMKAGQFSWKQFGGTHPSWFGHKFYTAAINRLFDETSRALPEAQRKSHDIPAETLETFCYDKGKFINIEEATKLKGFKIVKDWMPVCHKDVQLRRDFHHVPMLECTNEGSSFRLDFNGRAIGIFCVSGPSASILEYKIDNGPFKELNMATQWSKNLYIPWVFMFETELDAGCHTLTVKVKKGLGTECQIRNFVVNE